MAIPGHFPSTHGSPHFDYCATCFETKSLRSGSIRIFLHIPSRSRISLNLNTHLSSLVFPLAWFYGAKHLCVVASGRPQRPSVCYIRRFIALFSALMRIGKSVKGTGG